MFQEWIVQDLRLCYTIVGGEVLDEQVEIPGIRDADHMRTIFKRLQAFCSKLRSAKVLKRFQAEEVAQQNAFIPFLLRSCLTLAFGASTCFIANSAFACTVSFHLPSAVMAATGQDQTTGMYAAAPGIAVEPEYSLDRATFQPAVHCPWQISDPTRPPQSRCFPHAGPANLLFRRPAEDKAEYRDATNQLMVSWWF